jgi:hypothetical protein
MKHLLVTLAGVSILGTILPAVAGPDFHLIEQARKAHVAQSVLAARQLVLPLDHGPRAQTTPWLNKQRAHAQNLAIHQSEATDRSSRQ